MKAKIQQAQIRVQTLEENFPYLEDCLNHLVMIQGLLEEREETSISIKLHLLHDPERFIIARLLDPHGLDYTWPFGGLVFAYEAIGEDNDEEIKPEYIFIEDVTIVGAGWDKHGLCLTDVKESTKLWKIRGIPADVRELETPQNCIQVSLFSSRHSGELMKVPLHVGDKSVEFWERKNIYLRTGQ